MDEERLVEARDLGLFGEADRLSAERQVTTGVFAGFDSEGRFLVIQEGAAEAKESLSTVGLSESDIGRKLLLVFTDETGQRPVIVGRLQDRRQPVTSVNCKVDGERIVLRGERQIELRCGEASIVLTQAGKVLIKGNFVLSRSRGANKVKGAYVDIN